jgi:hypothetical protein
MAIPTFTLNIPVTGQSLGSTRVPINNNFGNYAGLIAVNHVAPNAAGQGKHSIGEFVVQASDPATATNEITIYGKTAAGATEFFIRKDNSGNVYQLTTGVPILSGASGSSFLPGGIIIKWITVDINANPTTVNFVAQGVGNFPNNFFTAVVTPNVNNQNINATLNNGMKNQIDVYTQQTGIAHFIILIGN